MTAGFGTRLHQALDTRGPLCVGIDPHPGVLRSWGLSNDASGLEKFTRQLVDSLGQQVAIFKPQSAFFEAHGPEGIAVLQRTLTDCREAGALTLLDVKRGDIGSTMDAYAAAYLAEDAPLAADAVTLSPYLGFGSLRGAIELAGQTGRGVFVLALTSNPEGPQVQHATTSSGLTVGQTIVDAVAAVNADRLDQTVPGDVGIVVGATIGKTGTDFSRLGGPILSPGLGAQGGMAEDLREVFGTALPWVLPSMSREILQAGPDSGALRTAVSQAVTQMNDVLGLR